ncbi:MAG: hypothetical protein IKH57_15345 [Clostridia bacterium]|nr:hypothetical protein [Clostridia bacterium]
MLAIAYFALFILCGSIITFSLFPRKPVVVRCWLGICLGIILMMWFPALFAFIWEFSFLSHGAAILLLLLLTAIAFFTRDRGQWAAWSERDAQLIKLLLCVALPLTLVGGWLQWTHTIRPMADGTLHVGQSTYGDLPLHLAIASSLRNASFPPEYNILPGELLAYPFLADSLSSTFMLLGCSLRAAILIPGIAMTALVFAGYCILAERMADTRKGAMLAALFFFLNGGLGFFYLVDMQGAALGASGSNELQSVTGLWQRIQHVLNGWYQTPANHAEFGTYNLRWSNVIVDMMVPQRTTLAGWCEVIPCIYLLYDALRPETPWGMELRDSDDRLTALWHKREMDWRQGAMLGLWAGMLPMVNTHCFLALGLLSAGWIVYDLAATRHQRKNAALFWAAYGLIAVAVAAPQLFTWTFNQAIGNTRFLQIRFNWVNNTGNGLRDGYLWFYIKNIGLPFILIILALIEKNEKRRFIACGAFVIFLVAEFVQIQPNEYDNNKLFYIWYMLCAVIAADYGLELLGRLKGLRARSIIAALCAVICFSTGLLAVAREWKSDYEMFSKEAVGAAAFVEKNTDQHAMFLTDYSWHINFVSSLTGRNIVCGPDTWLYYHGYNTDERKSDIWRFYADPENSLDVLEKYEVDYILVSNNERSRYQIDEAALERLFTRFYQSEYESIIIYSVRSI